MIIRVDHSMQNSQCEFLVGKLRNVIEKLWKQIFSCVLTYSTKFASGEVYQVG